MNKSIVVLGTQWGDEGKGKIVDLLSQDADAVVRFQGGHNAGHTLVIDGEKTVLHPDRYPGCKASRHESGCRWTQPLDRIIDGDSHQACIPARMRFFSL